MDKDQFDFWYAVNNTRVVLQPRGTLETFGTTQLRYHLVTELMDSVGRVRVREGSVQAGRPQIMTPGMMQDALENFGPEAHEYLDWLRQHESDLKILQYGFVISKNELSEHVVTQNLDAVVDELETDLRRKDDPLGALVVGVDKPWEVCLLKMLRDVVAQSAHGNLRDFVRADRQRQQATRDEVERDFVAASRDAGLLKPLSEKLRRLGLFEEYEDRFFALVKAHR